MCALHYLFVVIFCLSMGPGGRVGREGWEEGLGRPTSGTIWNHALSCPSKDRFNFDSNMNNSDILAKLGSNFLIVPYFYPTFAVFVENLKILYKILLPNYLS